MKVHRYRPVLEPVEAVRVTEENLQEVADWCNGSAERIPQWHGNQIRLPGAFGTFFIFEGNWLIKRANGTFTQLGDAEFQRQYRRDYSLWEEVSRYLAPENSTKNPE